MKADMYTTSNCIYTPSYDSIIVWDKSFHKHINATIRTVISIHKCFEDICHKRLIDRLSISTVTHGTCKSSGSNSLMRFVESSFFSFMSKASMAAFLDASLRSSIIVLNKGTFACTALPIYDTWKGQEKTLILNCALNPSLTTTTFHALKFTFRACETKNKQTFLEGLWHCP